MSEVSRMELSSMCIVTVVNNHNNFINKGAWGQAEARGYGHFWGNI